MFGSSRRSPRLADWDGRRRSSRCDTLFDWSALKRRAVLLRAAVVVATAALVAAILIGDGPPLPYRVGQSASRDLRARVAFDVVNEAETAKAAEEHAPPVVEKFPAGLLLQSRDKPITPEKLSLLRAEHRAFVKSRSAADRWGRGVGLSLVVALLAATVALYSSRFQPAVCERFGAVVGIGFLIALSVWLASVLNRPPWHAGVLPLTVAAMVLTIAYNPPFALLISLCVAIVASLAEGPNLRPLLAQMGGLAAAVLTMRQVR
ncbi:MAG TPA: hypothetical protein VMZ71_12290, partial [Gemmataceae bacterium]|nr:hypothetical protein [Gemmataceae bacterium]